MLCRRLLFLDVESTKHDMESGAGAVQVRAQKKPLQNQSSAQNIAVAGEIEAKLSSMHALIQRCPIHLVIRQATAQIARENTRIKEKKSHSLKSTR